MSPHSINGSKGLAGPHYARAAAPAAAICVPHSGKGPGVLLLVSTCRPSVVERAEFLAREGYVVVPAIAHDIVAVNAALTCLAKLPAVQGKLAAIASGDAAGAAAVAVADRGAIDGLVLFDHVPGADQLAALPCPATLHVGVAECGETETLLAVRAAAARDPARLSVHVYREAAANFTEPDFPNWNPNAAEVAHPRCLAYLRIHLGRHGGASNR